MKNFQLIKQGAEARLYTGTYLDKPTIVKERFVKKYRHKHLDDVLTKERIKAETRAVVRCKAVGIHTPMLYLIDFDRRMIFMEHFVHSITLKDFIENNSIGILCTLALRIGKVVGQMHEGTIVHGDLTSSNILLVNIHNKNIYNNIEDLKIVLIDFGLAHTDCSAEDKGVDLYVLERALISTHAVADKIFPKIMEGYMKHYRNGCREVISKYEEVRARGRKRTMVG